MIGKQVTLKSIPEGTTFQAFGDWFIKLECVDGGILSLRRDIWERGIPDGDDRNDAHTDGVSRSLKRYSEFLADAGMPEDAACVTLLTQQQYHRNQHLIPPLDEADLWWLEQHEKIPDKKCGNMVKGRMLVEYGTSVEYCRVPNTYGVRPAVIFNPSTAIVLEHLKGESLQ